MEVLITIAGAVVGSGAVTVLVNAVANRRRSAAGAAVDESQAAVNYRELASTATRDYEDVKRKLRRHDRRWELALGVLRKCANGDTKLAKDIDDLHLLNGLSAIDDRAEKKG